MEILINVEKEADTEIIANEDNDDEFDLVGHHYADLLFYGEEWQDRINNINPFLEEIDKKTTFDNNFVTNLRHKLEKE